MNTRFACALLALALPLSAQQDVPAAAENTFYKAFYLEKGVRDFEGAMKLYAKFLAMAPEHDLASVAARQQFSLLNKTGRTKERDVFREKYAALLGRATDRRAQDRRDGDESKERERPRGRDRREMGDPKARIAELEKELAEAKKEGDEERAEGIGRRIERLKRMGERRASGGRFGGRRGGMFGGKALTEMNDEELERYQQRLDAMGERLDRMRERMGEERAAAFEKALEKIVKAIEAGELEEAEKVRKKMAESFRRRRGGGGGAR